MSDEIEIVLRHLSVLHIEPGDTLVLMSPNALSLAYIESLKASFTGYRLIVLQGGMELGVIRAASADE